MRLKKTKPIRIAIDATAGSGSTSLAQRLARHYKLRYLDPGKVYRWCALQIIQKKPKNKINFLKKRIKKLNLKKLQDKNYYGMRHFNRVSLNYMWINYMKKNEFNRPHTHSGSFSFVLYLQVPEATYTASGQYPKKGIDGKSYPGGVCSVGPGCVNFFYGEEQTGIITAHGIKPLEGDLWIFPAPLRHMVPPFRVDGTRISVSGHLTISDESNEGQQIQPNEFILNN